MVLLTYYNKVRHCTDILADCAPQIKPKLKKNIMTAPPNMGCSTGSQSSEPLDYRSLNRVNYIRSHNLFL